MDGVKPRWILTGQCVSHGDSFGLKEGRNTVDQAVGDMVDRPSFSFANLTVKRPPIKAQSVVLGTSGTVSTYRVDGGESLADPSDRIAEDKSRRSL